MSVPPPQQWLNVTYCPFAPFFSASRGHCGSFTSIMRVGRIGSVGGRHLSCSEHLLNHPDTIRRVSSVRMLGDMARGMQAGAPPLESHWLGSTFSPSCRKTNSLVVARL